MYFCSRDDLYRHVLSALSHILHLLTRIRDGLGRADAHICLVWLNSLSNFPDVGVCIAFFIWRLVHDFKGLEVWFAAPNALARGIRTLLDMPADIWRVSVRSWYWFYCDLIEQTAPSRMLFASHVAFCAFCVAFIVRALTI